MKTKHISIGSLLEGEKRTGNAVIDLDILMKSRLLVQANSGGGKSYLIRLLAERFYGHVPVFIIDPEGEFSTLREKFGYVLVGPGGETPCDVRSARLVALKLLELRASAVIDLYELSVADRHIYVREFLDSLMNAPKKLWLPMVGIVDEAHVFCPERGEGDSVATEKMLDYASKARKRHFCPIFATQRLAKLHKTASAELHNRLIGLTYEDVDVKRARDLLMRSDENRRDFDSTLRSMDPGFMYGIGRAISKTRVLIDIDEVETTHEIDESKPGSGPPPTPDKVKAFLPKLADLPQLAEAKAKTEAELRKELQAAQAELKKFRTAEATTAKEQVKAVKEVAKDSEIKKLKQQLAVAMKFIARVTTQGFESANPEELQKALEAAMEQLKKLVETKLEKRKKDFDKLQAEAKAVLEQLKKMIGEEVVIDVTVQQTKDVKVSGHVKPPTPPSAPPKATVPLVEPSEIGKQLGKCERAILQVLAQRPDGCLANKLCLLAGYTYSGSFKNSLTTLRNLGCMVGSNTEVMRITDVGMEQGPFPALPEGEDLVKYWLNHHLVGKCERAILEHLIANKTAENGPAIAAAVNYEYSGSFKNSLTALRTAGLILGKNMEQISICKELNF